MLTVILEGTKSEWPAGHEALPTHFCQKEAGHIFEKSISLIKIV